MKANTEQIAKAMTAPTGTVRLFLLHGPDEAGALALAATLGRALGASPERVDVTGAMLRSRPGLLAEEAASLSLFGERRWIRGSAIGDESTEAATLLLRAEQAEHPVVLIGPSLKGTSKLVKLALADRAAMSFACYVPEGREAERLVVQMARDHGLRCADGVAARLVAVTGADRAVLARELEKLALYLDAAPARPAELTDDALERCGAALEEGETDPVIAAALAADGAALAEALAQFERAAGSGVPLMRQLARRLMLFADLRGAVAQGESVDAAMERHRVFFREKPVIARALQNWSAPALQQAILRVRIAERRLMDSQAPGEVMARAETVAVARLARRR